MKPDLFLTAAWAYCAYLDPGSGSFIIQLLIGLIAGLAVLLRTQWGRIRAWWTQRFGRTPPPPPAPPAEAPDGQPPQR